MNDVELIDSVWDNINAEINGFRNEAKSWSPQEKANNEEKLRFYEGMTKYLADANILYRHGKSVLKALWNFSLKENYGDCDEEFIYEEFFLSGAATAAQGELC